MHTHTRRCSGAGAQRACSAASDSEIKHAQGTGSWPPGCSIPTADGELRALQRRGSKTRPDSAKGAARVCRPVPPAAADARMKPVQLYRRSQRCPTPPRVLRASGVELPCVQRRTWRSRPAKRCGAAAKGSLAFALTKPQPAAPRPIGADRAADHVAAFRRVAAEEAGSYSCSAHAWGGAHLTLSFFTTAPTLQHDGQRLRV